MGAKKCKNDNCELKPRAKTNISPFTPDLIAEYAVHMFFFTIMSTWIIGIVDVLPNLYKERGNTVVLLQRFFVSFIFTEMMLNWFCIRYVDSSYAQYRKSFQKATETDKGEPKSETNTTAPGIEQMFLKPSTMDFSSDMKVNRKGEKVLTYSYWSWTPCFKCDVMKPPRCHHCPVCKTCILKRDHHCYFAGSCVGWRNQRHFIIFCLWASLACSYALVHAIYYVYLYLWSSLSVLDLFPPFTVLRCLLGYVSPLIVVYMSVTCFLFYFILVSTSFFLEHIRLVGKGLTSFEGKNLNCKKTSIADLRPFSEKLKSVIGPNWGLSIFLPLHNLFPPSEDPVNWPDVQVSRHDL